MLTAKAQYDLANAEKYFKEHLSIGDHHVKGNYYSENSQVIGRWFGAGADKLNLHDEVVMDDFVKLCRNINPCTGELLTQRMKSNRRVFYDFTLSPPKSVSIVALVGGDSRVERAHKEATMSALGELEKFAAARVRKHGASAYRNTGNIITAIFQHDTSRALDAHLHCHCVVFNATFDATEEKWKALETYEMLQAAKYAENVYYHELAQTLKQFGYDIQNNQRGDFEIKGISTELIKKFSKRHSEIDEKTRQLLEQEPDKRGRNLNEIREHIAHNERARKIKDIGRKRLNELWSKQISTEEKEELAQLKRHQPEKGRTKATLKSSVSWAEEHLFDRRSVVNEFDVWRYALERGRGSDFSLANLKSLTAHRSYVRGEEQQRKITTHATLEREQRLIAAAKDGRNQFMPFGEKHDFQNAGLDAEQQAAAKQILASKDFVTLFRGGAGTGKSFTLKEIRDGLLTAGHFVYFIAPQRQQVIDLEKDFGCRGATLSEFLMKEEMKCGAVVVLDEAGQVGAKQMIQLFELVQASGGRLILSGDTRQHGAVEASDALRAIERFSGLEAVELKTVRRQNPELAKSKAERAAIKEYKQAVIEARDGLLTASFERLNKNGSITQCGFSEQHKFLAEKFLELAATGHSTVVVSQTWSELSKVNEHIRNGMKTRGMVGTNEVLVTSLVRLDLTNAQKRDERYHTDGSVVLFNRNLVGIKQGAWGRLVKVGEHELLVSAEGITRQIPFDQLEHVSVCEPKEIALACGDRIQLKANAKTESGEHLANGELVTVKQVEDSGQITLGDGRILPRNYRQFVRGYAITSYAAQGKTADYVIFSDAAIRAATNQKQWYVTISRGRRGIHIFTSDKEQLRENISHSGNRQLAVELTLQNSPIKAVLHRLQINTNVTIS
ncbi:MAG TPA: MobF family relaxase [Verrucomicrobiae bacterium]|nr:MobF family relaxase [Verrucomicrobiae bacterium]